MKIYAISVIQNEGDIIRETLEWAAKFCERIWVWDLASTDNTWDVLQDMKSPQIIPERKENLPFVNSVKGQVYNSIREQIGTNDWIYVLDADEFVAADPKPVLAATEDEGADIVGGWQVNFIPTDEDVEEMNRIGVEAWTATPIQVRLRHYRVEWSELRFIRNIPGLICDTGELWNRWITANGKPLNISRKHVLLQHYRYRTPAQVALRHPTRMDSRHRDKSQFGYDKASDFFECIRPAKEMLHWEAGVTPLSVPPSEILRARMSWIAARIRKAVGRRIRRK